MAVTKEKIGEIFLRVHFHKDAVAALECLAIAAEYMGRDEAVPRLIGLLLAPALRAATKRGLESQERVNAFGRELGILADHKRPGLPALLAGKEGEPAHYMTTAHGKSAAVWWTVGKFIIDYTSRDPRHRVTKDVLEKVKKKFGVGRSTTYRMLKEYKASLVVHPEMLEPEAD